MLTCTHSAFVFLVSNVIFVVECVFFLHSFAIAILLSKAFPVQLGIKMTNLSSADFILPGTEFNTDMYVHVCIRVYEKLVYAHSIVLFYSYQVWSHGLLNFKFTSSTSCVDCG